MRQKGTEFKTFLFKIVTSQLSGEQTLQNSYSLCHHFRIKILGFEPPKISLKSNKKLWLVHFWAHAQISNLDLKCQTQIFLEFFQKSSYFFFYFPFIDKDGSLLNFYMHVCNCTILALVIIAALTYNLISCIRVEQLW